jgi:YVTN family beta-propeller protein
MRRAVAVALLAIALAVALATAGCGVRTGGVLTGDTKVPDVSGMTLDEAGETLSDAGFSVGVVEYDPDSTEATWTVVAQDPDEPSPEGTAVALLVAGAPPVDVPDLAGLDEATALERLSSAGLTAAASERSFSETVPESAVVTQSPAPGAAVPSGTSVVLVVSDGPEPSPSDTLTLELVDTISGDYSPKSVVATQEGQVFAQNMMYRHNVTVFDDETRDVLAVIPDSVDLAAFGYPEYPGTVRGGPVEAAVTPDGRHVYVSNYSMFGPGFERPGDDVGGPDSGVDPSFVYRIPTDTLEVDQVIQVGSVPKYLTVTPDGRYVLVSNWISYDLSVIDTDLGEEVRRIPLGRYPRGIAVDSDSRTAYVAVMGSYDVATVDLETFDVGWVRGVGSAPRHLVISPDDRYLYATINGEGVTVKVDLESGDVVGRVATGAAPRSMAMAPDGRSLYVVNNESNTVSKVRTSDMTEIQELDVGTHPIGVTYVEDSRDVWVSCYRGQFFVFHDAE